MGLRTIFRAISRLARLLQIEIYNRLHYLSHVEERAPTSIYQS